MSITIEEYTAKVIRNYLGGNYDGRVRDGSRVVKILELTVTLAVLRGEYDGYAMIDTVWDGLIAPEIHAARGISMVVDEFLPNGAEWYVRDTILEVVEEMAAEVQE